MYNLQFSEVYEGCVITTKKHNRHYQSAKQLAILYIITRMCRFLIL